MCFNSTDLPSPLRPMMTSVSPLRIGRSTASSTCLVPKRLLTPSRTMPAYDAGSWTFRSGGGGVGIKVAMDRTRQWLKMIWNRTIASR